jgi:fructose-bisphosphate aldolase, class I
MPPSFLLGSPDPTRRRRLAAEDHAGAEALLRAELTSSLDALPDNRQVMLKLTIAEAPDFYLVLISHKRVARVVALSGGYTRDDVCNRLPPITA